MEFVGKLDKKDKKVLIWGFIVGTILNIFIHKAIEIVIMLVMLYFLHKNFDINKFTENMEFINKEKYIEGLNKIIRVFDIYIAIKIILTLVIQMGGFNAMEFALVGEFALIYNGMLARKYVKSIDNVEVERNRKLIKNKILTAVILIGFVGFTCNYLNKLEFKDNYINSPKYKYELTYDKENNRIADFSGNGFSMIATENKDNEKNFNKYIKEIKLLSAVDVLQDYSKVALIFMLALTFAQLNFRAKDKRPNVVFVNVFLVLAFTFGAIGFNTYDIDLEYKVIDNFANYNLYYIIRKRII